MNILHSLKSLDPYTPYDRALLPVIRFNKMGMGDSLKTKIAFPKMEGILCRVISQTNNIITLHNVV